MSLRVSCPSCKLVCQVAREHVGAAIRCPGCKQGFTVRMPAQPATDPDLSLPGGRVRLAAGCATSPGRVRARNEDCLLLTAWTWAGQEGRHDAVLAMVADGMGGHEGGDRASSVAIAAVATALAPRLAGLVAAQETVNGGEALVEVLDNALWQANRAVAEVAQTEAGCAGMGATAVAALVVDRVAAVCHVGDCRAYLYRDGGLRQMTRDQTVVSRMVDLGQLSEKEARHHRAASQVTQALGRQFELEPSRQTIELRPGDTLVLACDGLHAHLDAEALGGLIALARDPAELADTLVRRADEAGGSDNCTVIVLAALI